VVAVALVALGLLAACSAKPAPSSGTVVQVFKPAERKAAPQLTGDLLDGSGSFRLSDHAGEVVVINFWASWCGPCVAEADDLEATYLATKDSKVTFLGINTRDERDPAKSFLLGRATYPNVFDPSGKLALGFAVAPTAIPSTVVVDRSGRIAAVARGALLREDLEPVVTTLAAESS
jgi:thiol-disulfide isomerase/thioredoxin